jgi:hypothetical protein
MAATYSTTVLGNDGSGSGQDTFGMTVPGGTAVGTLAIISAIQHVTTGTFSLSGGDGGWTTLSGPDDASTNARMYVWAKELTAGDIGATITVTSTSAGRFVGRMDLFTDAQLSGTVDAVSNDTSADTSVVAPGVSIGSTNFLILNLYGLRISSATAASITTMPASHTARGGLVNSASSSPNVSIAASTFDPVASGTQGGGTATADAATMDITYSIGIADSAVATQNLDPTAIASSAALGTPAVSTTLTVTPTAIASAAALGTPDVSTTITVSPTAIASLAALGNPALSMTITLAPGAIATGESLGEPTITSGASQLAPDGIASAAALGEPTITFGIAVVLGDGIATGESVGQPVVTPTITLAPDPVVTGESLGDPVIAAQQKHLRFTPPYLIRNHQIAGGLIGSLHFGISIFRIDGVWYAEEFPSVEQETTADVFYRGGHIATVTEEEAADLEAEGYTIVTEYQYD